MNTVAKVRDYSDLDLRHLTRELDKVKSDLFSKRYASFYGSLLCSLNFFWTPDIATAATDGINLMWNPYWFLKLSRASRLTVLMHELLHVAKLHFHRWGERHPKVWNYATDIKINNELEDEGFSFADLPRAWKDQSYPDDIPEEDIYDDLVLNANKMVSTGAWGQTPGGMGGNTGGYPDDGSDMFPPDPEGPLTKEQMAQAVNNVIRATHQAKLAGPDQIPGSVESILKQFLAPIVPWEQLLHRFMHELVIDSYSWRKPNRRFSELYLPSRFEDEGALDHLIYFEDTSGSISDKDAIRFNSEFKYVKEHYKPKKMSLVQFDTSIQQVIEYTQDDPFDQVKIMGRGGTSLECIRQYINKHKPTAAVVFSDLQCDPMGKLEYEIPIIWVTISNPGARVPFGQVIHIR